MNPCRSRSTTKLILAALAVGGLAGCASTATPVVYPAAKATQNQRAVSDLKACRAQADAAVGINGTRAQTASTRAAQRGAVEFVDKAVESLVNGSKEVWAKARGAGAGAMAGSVTLLALNWNEPDSVYRNYVDLCLKERGHKVLGWR